MNIIDDIEQFVEGGQKQHKHHHQQQGGGGGGNCGGGGDKHPSAQDRKYLDNSQRHRKSNQPHHTFESDPNISSSVDLRDQCPAVYDQGQLGSCTANALAAAFEFNEMKQGQQVVGTPSRLFIYYNERAQEGDVSTDAGAFTGDGVKGLHNLGVVSESEWPYDVSKFADKPSNKLFENAKRNTVTTFKQVALDQDQIKQALHQGYPVLFTADIFPAFEGTDVGSTGNVPMPQSGEKSSGGHALLIVGFDDNSSTFTVRNSWGASWGDQGYCYFPYDYVLDSTYTSQFWVLLGVSD